MGPVPPPGFRADLDGHGGLEHRDLDVQLLAIGESAITVTSAVFALLVSLHLMTPGRLLLFSFLAMRLAPHSAD